MKKILCVLFIILITLSLTTFAFAAEGESADTAESVTEEEAENENIFATLYSWVCENSGEIFSLLTLISSGILAFTYKRGLLPKLSGALGKIGGAVGNISQSTEEALGTLGESYSSLKDGLSVVSGLCEGLSDEVSELSARLEESADTKSEVEKMKIILSSQIDMLYEIFLSSALPQFAKEAVAERVTAMRRTLSAEDTKNE